MLTDTIDSQDSCIDHIVPSYTLSAIQPLRDHPSVGKLTKTNDVPTAEQERILRDMISDLKTRLDHANTSTERLKAVRAELNRRIDDQLDLLERESGALRLAISDRSAVLAVTPMRRLPSELLVHIFSYAVTFPGIRKYKDKEGGNDYAGEGSADDDGPEPWKTGGDV